MAENLPFTLLPGQEDRILHFLNSSSTPTDITDNTQLKDDPFYDGTGGYTIGEKVATNLINARKKLPRERFHTIEQVLAVKGIGHDKVRDIMSSFWQPAAAVFKQSLRNKLVILDNWKVECWHFDFIHDEAGFRDLVQEEHLLRHFVRKKVKEIVREKHNNYALSNLASTLLQYLPMERSESRLISSHEWALWWYRFDQDNWFSFERILAETTAYFNHYNQQDLELVFFRGFVNGGTLSEAVTTNDLPIILNHGERRITIWAVSLYD